jgi:hypothetical protein
MKELNYTRVIISIMNKLLIFATARNEFSIK